MSGGSIRSFIAVDLNDYIRDNISTFQKTLVATNADLKLVESHNTHITLRFLGEVSTKNIDDICNILKNLKFSPFNVSLKGIGVFPNISRINVIWIGLINGLEELVDIFNQLEQGFKRLGLRSDDRGFSPHITIARVKSGRNKDELSKIVSDAHDLEFGTMEVESVRLKKSVITPRGPIYSTICDVLAIRN